MKIKPIQIGEKIIGDGYPCFIIAEAGSNHNGNLEQALGLIDIAAEAKADAVKFQTFRADKLYVKTAGQSRYLKMKKSIYEIIKEMEMPADWVPELASHCKKRNIIFLSTPTDEDCVDLLEPYVPAYKVASYEMTHIPLVEYLARKKKPIFLSTGAAELEEIRQTVKAIKKTGNRKIILMQSTASYPAPISSVNVRTVSRMKQEFKVPVGLSDHSREPDIAPIAAVVMGANCIEKHFTFSNLLPGPDHRFALEPDELKIMVEKIRAAETTLGSGKKKTLKIERELRRFARRSIFAIKEVKMGERFTENNVAVLRSGIRQGHLKPVTYQSLLKKKARRNIKVDQAVRASDYATRS